jgi:hypothetical protein
MDAKDLFQFFEALTRTETYLANAMKKGRYNQK